MIEYQDVFHVGVRVPDLDAAMADVGPTMGITWAEARENERQALWTPEGGTQEIHHRYTYSAEGPQHLELLEGSPGSFWDGRGAPGAHHVGVWADDVTAETERIVAAGWTLVGAHRDPGDGGGYGIFNYLKPPSGLIVELVDRAALAPFEQWWAAALD
jgi:hypothetical protein